MESVSKRAVSKLCCSHSFTRIRFERAAAGAYIEFSKISGLKAYRKRLMAGLLRFSNLAPKTKNIVVAGGLTSFVFRVYFYTMRAVGGTDELQIAIEKLEVEKGKSEAEASLALKA